MRVMPAKSGAALALLAMCLQVAVSALGGRICYRVAPLPASADCASACCGTCEIEAVESETANLALATFPFAPGDSDCCLRPAPEYPGQPTGHEKLPPPTDLPAAIIANAATEHLLTPMTTAPSPARRLGLAPPSLPIVRTTILLL